MIQKAVEMGVARISPVITRRTQVNRVNLERMEANAIEAAEQCGILSLPTLDDPQTLDRWLAGLGDDQSPGILRRRGAARRSLAGLRGGPSGRPVVLIGPEGGFARKSGSSWSGTRAACASRSACDFAGGHGGHRGALLVQATLSAILELFRSSVSSF